jgi:uncharacterized repeat protein (TIGR03847 family)
VSRRIWTFSPPTRCVIGTVGLPGERTFYLQVSDETAIVSLRIEKQQADLLASRILEILAEVGLPTSTSTASDADAGPLTTPVEEDFSVGAIGLAWDPQSQSVIIEAHDEQAAEAAELGDDDDEAGDTVRVFLSVDQAAAFCARTKSVVAAGRPPCPLCGLVLEPTGHICPRANGYRRR